MVIAPGDVIHVGGDDRAALQANLASVLVSLENARS